MSVRGDGLQAASSLQLEHGDVVLGVGPTTVAWYVAPVLITVTRTFVAPSTT
jgi:alkylated DNA repair dioxygenase AlkB